ncbi:hypothetical protein KIN20_006833 [Parelaphostrongylus tenuis]|uniref:Uncharacterized protein n=1 Tax=Parelaphostrongylus tenuis TaxID=148309 RepID=A0AAD5MKP1_PARTN|nr:hypothetical protein KIN20_006833 [Parelaphostrongylus tenuis]
MCAKEKGMETMFGPALPVKMGGLDIHAKNTPNCSSRNQYALALSVIIVDKPTLTSATALHITCAAERVILVFNMPTLNRERLMKEGMTRKDVKIFWQKKDPGVSKFGDRTFLHET